MLVMGVVSCWYEHRAIIGSETRSRKVIWYSILSPMLVFRNSGILKGSSSGASQKNSARQYARDTMSTGFIVGPWKLSLTKDCTSKSLVGRMT